MILWACLLCIGFSFQDCEPIVSFVEIMSEDLAGSLTEEELRREQEFLSSVAQSEAMPPVSIPVICVCYQSRFCKRSSLVATPCRGFTCLVWFCWNAWKCVLLRQNSLRRPRPEGGLFKGAYRKYDSVQNFGR